MDKNEDKKKNELEEVNLSKTQEILMKIIEKLDKKPDKKRKEKLEWKYIILQYKNCNIFYIFICEVKYDTRSR